MNCGCLLCWRRSIVSVALLIISGGLTLAQTTRLSPERAIAQRLFQEGNYREAFDKLKVLALEPTNEGAELAEDFRMATLSLQFLQRMADIDPFREEVLRVHSDDWRLLLAVARSFIDQVHYGQIIAGEFRRGQSRGRGTWADATERDRARALQIMLQASPLWKTAPVAEQAEAFLEWARILLTGREGQGAWQLQARTDLSQLPDLQTSEDSWGWRGGPPRRGAPVDAAGRPVFHQVPKSWDAAETDGERWRWCLEQAGQVDPQRRAQVDYQFAQFLHEQFGVHTMSQWGIVLPREDVAEDREGTSGDERSANPFALESLREEETIARLATGVQRFELPDEFNPIKWFQKISDGQSGFAEQSLEMLATIFEDRQQYPRAADYWRKLIDRFGPGGSEHRKQRLSQIVDPWGRFESSSTQPAGTSATLDYRFRNGTQLLLNARIVHVERLLQDIQAYIRSQPREFDWNRMQIDNIGQRLIDEEPARYLGEQVAEWSLALEPKPGHRDRRITVGTPLQKAGAYLVTARLQGGNVSRILVWIDDLAILRKPAQGRWWYYVADAVTGAPMAGANVEFFGWRLEWDERTKHNRVVSAHFAETTDQGGAVEIEAKQGQSDLTWLAIARTRDGRLAHLGYSSHWWHPYVDQSNPQIKVYAITDRPVYRPEQKVQFKFWVREASYEREDPPTWAETSFTVVIVDPQGTEVWRQPFTADKYAGFSGEFPLPQEAKLGVYQLHLVDHPQVSGGTSFRVEEYKKPEFEVRIDAPAKPVMLGETITAKVTAKYYFGAPVTQGRVKYKVYRSEHHQGWYPPMPWDWLYGPGYWWFAPNYDWYPGFRKWGCVGPIPPWWGWNPHPPELVLDEEVALDSDGTAEIKIDTTLAQALHGDQDHQYQIVAEVVDASRRVIVGQGTVLAGREPFKVFVWTDRGYYRVGDTIEAHFAARTLDGRGVPGTGTLRLHRVRYDDQGRPDEVAVQTWTLAADAEGLLSQKIKASEPGQYRISLQFDDGQGHAIEGGQMLVITGAGFDGSEFRFNDLELTLEHREYQPNETARIMINTNRVGGTILVWIRPQGGTYPGRPQIVRLKGKSTILEVPVTRADIPNFFIEAVSISGARVHTELKEIFVPPAQRVVSVNLEADSLKILPGGEAKVRLRLTDANARPMIGSVVISVYDRALEYISGGSNVPNIKEFFWKWRRSHAPHSEHSLGRWFYNLLKSGEVPMSDIGVFGGYVADEDTVAKEGDMSQADALDRSAKGLRRGRTNGGRERMMAAPASAAEAAPGAGRAAKSEAMGLDSTAPPQMAATTVRTEFADTAYWIADLETDADGTAEVTFKMPENLTAWTVRTWSMGPHTEVGESSLELVTAKNILVRLQSPRFFVETDEIVLSAVVHNYLDKQVEAVVTLGLEGQTLEPLEDRARNVVIPAGQDTRVDWRVKAVAQGQAHITMRAETPIESDAMRMTFPVHVHGMLKTESLSGILRPDQDRGTMRLVVPQDRRPEQTRLELRYSPTLAAAMVDALPYLVDYPYGCTEQTLNRFVPTVITQSVLRRMGLDLEAIQTKRTNLNAQEIGDDRIRAQQWQRLDRNPVFDSKELERMVKKGVQDLTAMQLSDGGWGWFSGYGERSWPHTTAVVVHGLQLAEQNGVALVPGVLERGIAWLKRYQEEQVGLLREGDRVLKLPPQERARDTRYRTQADNLDALVYSVLVDADVANAEMADYLYRDRTKLSLYGMGLVGLAFARQQDVARRDMLIRNIDQFVVEDRENQTCYIDLPNHDSYWWYWYGDTIEANACYLKLLSRSDPKNPKASGLVKYLLNNRKHATYWNSTRDTAFCIEALADYLRASGEDQPNMTVEVWLDGALQQAVEITPQVLFTFDNSFVIEGTSLESGPHTLEIRRQGQGPLYFNAYLTNFTLEDFIPAAGLEIKVQRKFYRLEPRPSASAEVPGSRGQVIDQRIEKYDRVLLPNLASVRSGDLIEVELEVESKNDYEYLVFEDWKPAGCEPVDLRSGYLPSAHGAYVEFRDERVALFLRTLNRGKHSFSYRVRAETPGKFSALPTRAWAMYAPELRGNSDELKLRIEERPTAPGVP